MTSIRRFARQFTLLLGLVLIASTSFWSAPVWADDTGTSADSSDDSDNSDDVSDDNQATQKTHTAPGEYRFDAIVMLSGGVMAGSGSYSLTGYDKAAAVGLLGRFDFRIIPLLSVGAFYHSQAAFAFGTYSSAGLASLQQVGGDIGLLVGPVFRAGVQIGYYWSTALVAGGSLALTRADGLVVSPRVGFEVPVDDRGVFSFQGEISPQFHTGTLSVPFFVVINALAGVAIHFK